MYVSIGSYYMICYFQQCLPLLGLSMTETIVNAVQCLLLPQGQSGSPLSQLLPIHGSDANSLANQICRVVAEIRTRY